MKTELLITMFMLLGITVGAGVQQGEKDGVYYTINEEAVTATVSGCIDGTEQINIVESVVYDEKTYSVTSVGRYGFYGKGISSLSIPKSVVLIEPSAFNSCSSLSSVTFPSKEPYQLAIADMAFEGCSSLTSLVFPEGLTSIASGAFTDCSLAEVTFPNSLTHIGYEAFMGNNLESITIPKNVVSIEGAAFRGCPLKSINVAEENMAYFSSNNVLFNKEQTTIFLYPYMKTENEYVIPNTVDSIGEYCFKDCANLTSVIFPAGLRGIGDSAFSGSGLINITLPENPITFSGERIFEKYENLTSMTLPKGVTSTGRYTFYECHKLSSVTLPEGLLEIGYSAFQKCDALTTIQLPEGLRLIDDVAFMMGGLTSIVMPNSVDSIGESAFYRCTNLTSVALSPKIKTIRLEAFTMTGLKSITVPEGVVSIERNAFAYCNSLTTVMLPSTLTSIDEKAFSPCGALKDIYVWAEVPPTMKDNTFNSFTPTLHIPVGCRQAYDDDDFWYRFKNVVEEEAPKQVEIDGIYYTIEGEAAIVTGCSDGTVQANIAESVIFKSNTYPVTTIKELAFSDKKLSSVSIPKSISFIGKGAFMNCPLQTVEVSPDNDAYSSLDNILFNKEQTVLVLYSPLKTENEYVIPSTVNSIMDYCFSKCSNLASVTIPSAVTSIGEGAFMECTKLANIYVYAEVPPVIQENTFSYYIATLHVPAGCTAVYKAADYWANFVNIGEEPVSINQEIADSAPVYANGTLFLQEGDSSIVYVYTCEGKFVASYHTTESTCDLSPLAKGMYIVKVVSGSRTDSLKIVR